MIQNTEAEKWALNEGEKKKKVLLIAWGPSVGFVGRGPALNTPSTGKNWLGMRPIISGINSTCTVMGTRATDGRHERNSVCNDWWRGSKVGRPMSELYLFIDCQHLVIQRRNIIPTVLNLAPSRAHLARPEPMDDLFFGAVSQYPKETLPGVACFLL